MITSKTFNIKDMNCASCVNHIEKDVRKMPGVKAVSVNFAAETAEIEFEDAETSVEKIVEQIRKTGYKAVLQEDESGHDEHSHHAHHSNQMNDAHKGHNHHEHAAAESKREINLKLYKVIFGAIAGIILIILSMFVDIRNEGVIMMILTFFILLFTGNEFFLKGIPAFFLRARPNMDTLVALGVSAAFLYSSYNVLFTAPPHAEYFMDAAIIATFIMLGRYLEARAKGSASQAITKLLHLSAKTAHKILGTGEIKDVPLDEVQKGDTLLVKPGEKIPLDGVIIEGSSEIDESMITGESIPVSKKQNDQVIGATLNGSSSFKMKATKIGKETMLARMIEMVKKAQMSKAPIQKLVDVIANYFVWVVIVIALVTLAGWYFYTGDFSRALIYTVSVLIIACPCALGLATPISIVVGSGKGAEMGILLKNAQALEKIRKISVICFDKTGTITKGKPEVKEFKNISDSRDRDVLNLAYSLENLSEHPLAKSIISYLENKNPENLKVENFKAETGKGVSGIINNEKYYLGSGKFIKSLRIILNPDMEKNLENLKSGGHTVLLFSNGKTPLAYFGIQDAIRDTSKQAIEILHSKNIKTVMITGDNQTVAQSIAKQAGIDEVLAEAAPEDKVNKIKELQKNGEFVAMVGDGINDAPALATANVGIAIGTGTDIAIESADLVLVKGDLLKAAEAIELSDATLRNIKQNLFWAFIYNTVGIPIAALGFLNPMFSAAAMAFSSISVVLNALRLKRMRMRVRV